MQSFQSRAVDNFESPKYFFTFWNLILHQLFCVFFLSSFQPESSPLLSNKLLFATARTNRNDRRLLHRLPHRRSLRRPQGAARVSAAWLHGRGGHLYSAHEQQRRILPALVVGIVVDDQSARGAHHYWPVKVSERCLCVFCLQLKIY